MSRARSSLLQTTDLRDVIEAATRLSDISSLKDESAFHQHTAEALAPVIDGPWTASERYAFQPDGPARDFVAWKSGTIVEEVTSAMYNVFKPMIHEHAFFAEAYRCFESSVIDMGAFATRGKSFCHMGLYADFYRHLDITDQVSIALKLGPTSSILVTFSRDSAFTKRDFDKLALLRPSVGAAWRNWEALQHYRSRDQPTPQDLADRFALPQRRSEVLWYIAEGRTNPQIALALGLSVATIRKHVELLLADLGVENRREASLLVHRNGIGRD